MEEGFFMTKYAITGATGHFGQNALKKLVELVPATDIVALARNIQKAQATVPEGVEVRLGDYNDVERLTESLQGIDKLLFISSQPGGKVARATQHENVVTAAKNAGVKYIAYTSFPHADTATAPLASDHQVTEKLIKESGIDYSFLRNNWYLENEADSLKNAATQGLVYSADGKVGWALESEYSEAAALVLTQNNPKKVYEFAGKSRTYQDLADALKVKATKLSDVEYSQALQKSGMDEGTIQVILSIQDLITQGNLTEDTNDLPEVLGRELTPLSEALETIVGK